ncbi:MAG TPA: hypothetical protein PLI45_04190 [Candidatus Woesebacteria bacterium]|nr:hypothetical protein [Candidatus Woesebacteria bacterium]
MPKKVFYGDLIQITEIQKIFAGNPKVTVETKKILSVFGNESSSSKDTKIKGVALGNGGLVFTFKDGRHILNIGSEFSISKIKPQQTRWQSASAMVITKVSFTNSIGERVTIIR